MASRPQGAGSVRFRELRLVAFGPFTNQVIDFGEATTCDLHIVLGLNEAGKSSALRAIHALLFGFPHISRDAHVHPYERLRVGALIETPDGESIELARVKARQRDLRDAKDEPLDDSILRRMLGGIDEALYDRLFLVNHEELRQGGAGLLAGGGDLGVSLFGATLGTGNLAVVRSALHQRGEALFKSDAKARKPLLNAALHDYRNHMEKVRGLSVKPREHEMAAGRVSELAHQRQAKTNEVATLESEERTLRRLVSITGPLARRQIVIVGLEALADVPVIALDATRRREVAVEKRENAIGRIERENAALGELRVKIAGIVVPSALLERVAEIQTLAGDIALHEKALRDRGNRSRDLDTQSAVSARLRAQLGGAAPEDPVRVDPDTRTLIEKLGDEQATLLERQRVAQEHLQECSDTNDRSMKALADAVAPSDVPDAIVTWADAAAEQVPLALAASTQNRAVERAIGKLVASAEALSPPFDPLARPPAEPPPAAVIAEHEARVNDLEAEFAEQRTERNRLALRRDELHVQLAVLGADEVENLKERMLVTRRERDQYFSHLDDFLDKADLDLARDAYRQLGGKLSQADELADMLLTQADQVARRDQLAAEVADITRQHGERERELTDIAARREHLLTSWRELWQPCGIDPLDDAKAILTWRRHYEELTAQHTDLSLQLIEHQEVLRRSDEIADHLHTVLAAAGSPADCDLPLKQLVEHAGVIVKRAMSEIAAHQQIVDEAADAAKELAAAQRGSEQARERLKDWATRWAEVMEPLAISVDTPPAEARLKIALLDDLADSEKTAAELSYRIESIAADYDAFAETARALATTLAPDLREDDALELVRVMNRRVEVAKTGEVNRKRLKEHEDETLNRIAELEEELRDADGVLSRLCDQARCSSAEQLPAIEEQAITRDALRNELAELDKLIVEQGEQPIAELQQLVGVRTGDDLAAELAAHHDTLQDAKSELETLVEQHTEAVGALRRLDHGAEAAIEREHAEHDAARAGELAERYLVERAAAILLTRAIEHPREHSAQPILEQAQQLLPQLTGNSLTRLFVDDEGGDHPTIMARRANGGEVGVSGMSDGALDQLYLALRLAALEHHLDALPPLPVLLDDILVNYDEPRVTTTAPVFAEIAERTQVIVLTHHQHVATIAKNTLGERVRVHHLGEAR